jgi:tight adherence protein C
MQNFFQYLTLALIFLAVIFIVQLIAQKVYAIFLQQKIKVMVAHQPEKAQKRVTQTEYRPSTILETLAKLSLPEQGWQTSETRLKFVRAGFRSGNAPFTYYVIKSVVTIIIPLMTALMLATITQQTWQNIALWVVLIALVGYYLPDIVIQYFIKRRSASIRAHLPDLLDLLVVCVESGLGIDAAISRVSKEMARTAPIISEEFYMAGLEMRAGAGRIAALKNLALRVNLEDLTSLVTMLVQADKFGTSLGESLRIQSEVLRLKRRQRAEELAAKIPVKLLFPLVFFIFPALMIVLIGPAILQIKSMFT